MQRFMLIISKAVRAEIRAQLENGDQAEISMRLQKKGHNVSPAYLNQFLMDVKPARKIGEIIVQEARALLSERAAGNKEILQSLEAIASAA